MIDCKHEHVSVENKDGTIVSWCRDCHFIMLVDNTEAFAAEIRTVSNYAIRLGEYAEGWGAALDALKQRLKEM